MNSTVDCKPLSRMIPKLTISKAQVSDEGTEGRYLLTPMVQIQLIYIHIHPIDHTENNAHTKL